MESLQTDAARVAELAALLEARGVEVSLLRDSDTAAPYGLYAYVDPKDRPRGFVHGTGIPVDGSVWAVEAEWYEDHWSLSKMVRNGPEEYIDDADSAEDALDIIIEEVRSE